MERVELFLSLQTHPPPCLTNSSLRLGRRKLGPPNPVGLQTNRAKIVTNQGNRAIQANFHPLSTLFSVESELFLRSLPLPPVRGHSLPPMVLEMEVDRNLVMVLQHGPSPFATCSEVNRLKRERILSVPRNSLRARNVSRWG